MLSPTLNVLPVPHLNEFRHESLMNSDTGGICWLGNVHIIIVLGNNLGSSTAAGRTSLLKLATLMSSPDHPFLKADIGMDFSELIGFFHVW